MHPQIKTASAEGKRLKTGNLQRKEIKISHPVWSEQSENCLPKASWDCALRLVAFKGLPGLSPDRLRSLRPQTISRSDGDSYLSLTPVPLKNLLQLFVQKNSGNRLLRKMTNLSYFWLLWLIPRKFYSLKCLDSRQLHMTWFLNRVLDRHFPRGFAL